MGGLFRWSAEWVKRHPVQSSCLVILGLALFGGTTAYFSQPSPEKPDSLKSAQQALEEYDFSAAQEHLTELLRRDSGNAQAHFLFAQTCRRAPQEDFELADQHLRAAYGSGFPPAEIDLEIALLDFQSTGERGESEARLKSYLESQPDREPLILEALARGCLRSGRLNTANTWLDRWVKNHPDDWYARLWRGSLFQHMGQAPLAVEDYRQILRHRPDKKEIRRRLGIVLVASGYDFEEAQEYLEESRKEQAFDADALVALARCYQVLRQPEKARTLLGQVLNERPEHAEALISMALVEIELKQDEAALDTLVQLEPLVAEFDPQAAQERLLRLDPVAYFPYSTERKEKLLHLRGTALRRLGREEEARNAHAELRQLRENVTALTRAMQQQKERPNDPDVLCQIGELQMKLGRQDEGEGWLLQAIRANPGHQRAHQALAEYYETFNHPEAKQRAAEHRRLGGGKT